MKKTITQINFLHIPTPVHFCGLLVTATWKSQELNLVPNKGSSAKFLNDSWKSAFAHLKMAISYSTEFFSQSFKFHPSYYIFVLYSNSSVRFLFTLCCMSINQRLILGEFVDLLLKSTY